VLAMGREYGRLMVDLGYERFFAQGGDWGHLVTSYLAIHAPQLLYAIHLNLVAAYPPPSEGPDDWTPEEADDVAHFAWELRWEMAYAEINATKPDTLAVAHNDSPAGLAAWHVEKYRVWSDCDGDVERRFSKDDLLTTITLYWAMQTSGSAARMYWESRMAERMGAIEAPVQVPTAVSIFPKDILRSARRWTEPLYPQICFWRRHNRGGHFAAMEEPELLVADIREAFRMHRP
jgi:microsomal epoxide hydrolase